MHPQSIPEYYSDEQLLNILLYGSEDFDCYMNNKGGSWTAAASKIERSVIIVNSLKPLTIITKRLILDVAAVLDPPLSNEILKATIKFLKFSKLFNDQLF